MSIHNIRELKKGRRGPFDLAVMRQQRLSELTDGAYISTFEGVQPEKTIVSREGIRITRVGGVDRHKKSGSVALSREKQKSVGDFVNKDLHLPLPGYNWKVPQRVNNTGSLTSRRERKDSRTERPATRLEIQPTVRRAISPEPFISKYSFTLEYVVGKGGFGKVWKVKEKKTGRIYAMKEMLKIKIIKKRSVDSVMNEKQLLRRLNHPFIVNMHWAFQDTENLYLVMDYVNGGDLRYHMGNKKRFPEQQTKFVVACILTALAYLHLNNVIHRDLKPENLVYDRDGYIRLTDLGVSRAHKLNNSADTSGTPGYMAPEVICRKDHSFPSDFFALGVICYEMMLGRRPYVGRNRAEIRDHILSKQARIEQPPKGWSTASVDFVNGLLQRKPENRLGFEGVAEVREHNWLVGFDWSSLVRRTLKAPFIPPTIDSDYSNYKKCISTDSQIEDEQQARLLLRKHQTQEMFEGYEYQPEKIQKRLEFTIQ